MTHYLATFPKILHEKTKQNSEIVQELQHILWSTESKTTGS